MDRMTMDAVWKCIFGIDVNVQENPNLGYFLKAKEAVEGFSDFDVNFLATSIFPHFLDI